MAIHLVPEEPHRGAIGDLRAFQGSGNETIRRFIAGDLPGPPPSRLFGMRPVDGGLGKATFSMPVTQWLEDGFGIVWPGLYAMFADSPLGVALWTGLGPGKAVATSELNMNFIRPTTRRTTGWVGSADTIHLGNQVGLASILLADQEGRKLAAGTTKCLVTDVPMDLDAEYPEPDTGPEDPADPYLREPPGPEAYFTREEIEFGRPLEIMRDFAASGRVFPIARLTGMTIDSAEEGTWEGRIPASPWFSNGGPAVYGGLIAWLADLAMGSASYTLLEPGDVFATLDMNVRFVRPAMIYSGDLIATGRVQHHGRRLMVTSCEIRDSAGKRIAMASGSSLKVPGGALELAKGRLPDSILGLDGSEGSLD